ncbi:MAG: hypothetical protein LBG11_01525 [Bifidobacteriaceae bacterium]|nr:hypothetical protein [Bifidobacteriaceae bacterium]
MLAGVLRRPSAEQSAHQAEQAEQDRWESIAQLSAEYETIRRASPATQHHLLAQATGAARVANRRLIFGLIPAVPPAQVPPEYRAALADCERRMTARADHLLQQAIAADHPWLTAVNARPNGRRQDDQRRWRRAVRTIAAYRDMYGITSADPLGPAPTNTAQRVHRSRARQAIGALVGPKPAQPLELAAPVVDRRPPALGL